RREHTGRRCTAAGLLSRKATTPITPPSTRSRWPTSPHERRCAMSEPQKFRKKPVVIEAIQLTWPNWNAVCDFVPKPWFVRGVYVQPDGGYSDFNESDADRMGLLIQT